MQASRRPSKIRNSRAGIRREMSLKNAASAADSRADRSAFQRGEQLVRQPVAARIGGWIAAGKTSLREATPRAEIGEASRLSIAAAGLRGTRQHLAALLHFLLQDLVRFGPQPRRRNQQHGRHDGQVRQTSATGQGAFQAKQLHGKWRMENSPCAGTYRGANMAAPTNYLYRAGGLKSTQLPPQCRCWNVSVGGIFGRICGFKVTFK